MIIWHVLATSPFLQASLTNIDPFCWQVLVKYGTNTKLTNICWQTSTSVPWRCISSRRAADIKALGLYRGHGRTFAKSLARGMARGAAGVPATGWAEAAGTWRWGKAGALPKGCRNYWNPSLHSSRTSYHAYNYTHTVTYNIYICNIQQNYVCVCVRVGTYFCDWDCASLDISRWRKPSVPSTLPRFSIPKAPMKRAEWGLERLEGLVLLSVERFSWTCDSVCVCDADYISVDVQIPKSSAGQDSLNPNWQCSQSWRSNQIQAFSSNNWTHPHHHERTNKTWDPSEKRWCVLFAVTHSTLQTNIEKY